ncbi:hypothetical protein BHE74_00025417 [Ensete ventricosum]|nr:hypothetical protein BHE74_00025417 [Ensete ventricosum]
MFDDSQRHALLTSHFPILLCHPTDSRAPTSFEFERLQQSMQRQEEAVNDRNHRHERSISVLMAADELPPGKSCKESLEMMNDISGTECAIKKPHVSQSCTPPPPFPSLDLVGV